MLSGKPACKKQEANWTLQAATAFPQELESVKGGRGPEHHFPHWYSQVGVGEIVIVEVQRDAVVLVVGEVVGGVVGFDVVQGLDVVGNVGDVVGEVVDFVVVQGLDVVGDVVGEVVGIVLVGDVVGVVVGELVGELVEELVGVLVGDEVEDEEDGGGALQGSEDSKSLATYRSRVELPPQLSVELPVQGMLQELAGKDAVPLPNTTPQ